MAASGKNAIFSEINITPLTDVFLVLLVVVMIAAPVTNQQRDITMPTMTQSVVIDEKWPVIEVNNTGAIFSDGQSIVESGLVAHLTGLVPKEGRKSRVIRGDRAAQSGKVMDMMQAASEAGFEEVFISGELERKNLNSTTGG